MAHLASLLQLVVDSEGKVYGCWPTNGPAVNMWSNLPATAQLRSPGYQRRYQQWQTTVTEPVAATGKVPEVSHTSNLPLCVCSHRVPFHCIAIDVLSFDLLQSASMEHPDGWGFSVLTCCSHVPGNY